MQDANSYKDIIREALREEVEKLSELPPDQANAGLILLFSGAETRMTERIENIDLGLTHSSKYFNIGRRIADSIDL